MMFNSPIAKTQEQLVQAARSATSDYITNGTDLTEAVVKAASAIQPLTSEHVRRICEMTYHDAYERMFAEKTGMYQYVSFDPPDAIRAAEMLDALQLGLNNQANFDKLASSKKDRKWYKGTGAYPVDDLTKGELKEEHKRLKEWQAVRNNTPNRIANAALKGAISANAAGVVGLPVAALTNDGRLGLAAGALGGLGTYAGLTHLRNRQIKKDDARLEEVENRMNKEAGLRNYFDVMRGKNVTRAGEAVTSAGNNLQAHLHRMARNKQVMDELSDTIADTVGNRKRILSQLNVKPKNRKSFTGITDPIERASYAAFDPDLLSDADHFFSDDTTDALNYAQKEYGRRKRVHKSTKVMKSRVRAVEDAQKALSSEKGRTNRYRAGTGMAVALPTSIYAAKKLNESEKRAEAPMTNYSMPRKFQRMNTHELWVKAASGKDLQDHNPARELERVHRNLKDSISTVKSELYSSEQNEKLAMIDMVKQAKAGLSAGHSMEQVLHAALSAVDTTEPFMAKTAHDLCATIIEACASHQNSGFRKTASAVGKTYQYESFRPHSSPEDVSRLGPGSFMWSSKHKKVLKNKKEYDAHIKATGGDKSIGFIEPLKGNSHGSVVSELRKQASAMQEVNPNHPIPQRFKKLAEANIQRKHLEITLDELNKNMDYFNQRLVDDLTR